MTTADLPAVFQPVSLDVQGDLTYPQWVHVGLTIGQMARSTPWLAGDWWCYGEARYGQTAHQAAEAVCLNRQTLLNYGSVSRRIPPQDRIPDLSWYHHSLVAALPRAERNRWLKRSLAEGWDSSRLRAALVADKALPERTGSDDDKPPISAREALTLMTGDPVWREVATRALDTIEQVTCPKCGERFTP